MNLNDQLKKHHIILQKRYGQNFISDPALLARIADTCQWQAADIALEIGPGAGTLTRAIAARADKVLAVEIDRRLAPLLEENLAGLGNIRLVFADALASDLDALVTETFGHDGGYKLVANLPYYITTPLIMHVLEDTKNVRELVIMVQKEVADRLTASPGGRTYGAITVMVQYYAKTERAFDVGRHAFTPPPDVDSSILHLLPYEKKPFAAKDEAMFSRVVKAAFSRRRKTLKNSLQSLNCDKALIASCLEACAIDGARRAETLSVEEFVALADMFSEQGGAL